MRRLTMVAAIAALFLSFSANVALAGDDKAMPVTNKMCPLMGDAVDPKVRTEHEGQYVYFCCAGCVKMFEADPKAAIEKMSAEDRAAIAKNETCPVTGEKITSWDTKVEKDGKLVYLCCAGCKKQFEKS
jgi:YHS domain-containing protein